jgi:hypothetical protein
MKQTGNFFLALALMLGLVLTTTAFPAGGKKQINIIGALGMATSGIDDPIIDLGIEVELVHQFFVRFVLNSHLGSDRGYYDYYPSYNYGIYGSYYGGIGFNNGNVLHGLTAAGVFKIPVSRKVGIFVQAGLNYLSYSRYDYSSDFEEWKSTRQRGYGAGFGSGLEFYLGEKFGLLAGGTYRFLFEDPPQRAPGIPPQEKPSWLELYVGFYYHLKGR